MRFGINRLRGGLGIETVRMMQRREAEWTIDHEEYKAAITLLNYRHVCRLDHWPPALAQSVADWNMDPYMAVQGPNEFVYIGNLKDWNRLDDMANFTEPSGQTANAGATGEVCVPAIMQLLLCRLRAGCGRFLLQE